MEKQKQMLMGTGPSLPIKSEPKETTPIIQTKQVPDTPK
jgi:hypothetical protein